MNEATVPRVLESPSGLRVEVNPNGSIRWIRHRETVINLFPGTMPEGGPANIWLRIHGGGAVPLLGPASPSAFSFSPEFAACGDVGGIHYRLALSLDADSPAWCWRVVLENRSPAPQSVDLILVQDVGIADYGAIRLNEYFVSQYIDHTPLDHPVHGVMVASRQNQPMSGRHPWLLSGSLSRAVSFATDGLQLYGRDARPGQVPAGVAEGLPGLRVQHEHSMVALQDEPHVLAPGAQVERGFFHRFVPHHPAPTGPEDAVMETPPSAGPPAALEDARAPAGCLFATAPWLDGDDPDAELCDAWFGNARHHVETDGSGRILSFFAGGGPLHVASAAKERIVLRPHGHILRSGSALVPDESALTSTCWMDGVFHSMVTQGHVSINRFLSTCHGYLGIFRSHGLRIFVRSGETWRQLGRPSTFAIGPAACRWIYQADGRTIEVTSTAPTDRHVLRVNLKVTAGPPVDVIFTMHISLHGDDGIEAIPLIRETTGRGEFIRPAPESDVGRRFPDGGFSVSAAEDGAALTFGGDEALFADGGSRGLPFLTATASGANRAGLEIIGALVPSDASGDAGFWEDVAGGVSLRSDADPEICRLAAIHPWFVHNALIHYLSPRGLEQYSGGGWGTRDVCQGAFEFLMAQGRFAQARDLLLRVFRQQNPDGDWPQWFMFFERERDIRPGDSHGDIVFWPLLAAAQYLTATRDVSLLVESLPFHGDGAEDAVSLFDHVERAIDLILGRVIPGTSLAAYGHGDWNDALQPAHPSLRERLCSSWTVTLHHQTFATLAGAFRAIGMEERAETLEAMAANILREFQDTLIIDDVVAGLVHFPEGGRAEPWLHPRDAVSGISFSLLPMIHAVINDMFTPRQAEKHLDLIRRHLSGPDGAHLFDRPPAYHGGAMTRFQRAETATYFGREIGIMYMHAHLRYAEALARFGDAEGFHRALCLANPIGLPSLAPSSAPRQANCYFSSSDPAFRDRYEAYAQYHRVNDGEVALEGGWRIYSSGAGIAVRLLVQCFLGLRIENAHIVIDPVIPTALDGLVATLRLGSQPVEVLYRIGPNGCGPVSANLNGTDLEFVRDPNPYRPGALRVRRESVDKAITGNADRLTVWIG